MRNNAIYSALERMNTSRASRHVDAADFNAHHGSRRERESQRVDATAPTASEFCAECNHPHRGKECHCACRLFVPRITRATLHNAGEVHTLEAKALGPVNSLAAYRAWVRAGKQAHPIFDREEWLAIHRGKDNIIRPMLHQDDCKCPGCLAKPVVRRTHKQYLAMLARYQQRSTES